MDTWRETSAGTAGGLMLAVAVACFASTAKAQGVCVVCNEPEAVYRCQPEGGNVRPNDARLSLLCITELAKSGGHASCGVRRQQQGNCDGQTRTVAIAPSPLPPVGEETTAPPPAEQVKGKQTGPPDTVAEMAKRTANSSKEQLEKATDAVGNVAKKTGDAVGDVAKKTGGAVNDAATKSWRCLSTFFKDC